jgi:aspartyl-tRNA(Asn)/glutamyl-tRNA(Gln) amidotransferase subunit B
MNEGFLTINLPNEESKKIRIEKLQIEMDSGKSVHDQDPKYSLIDLNRAGIGLMEIVTYPDISNSTEAEIYVKELQYLLRHIGTCDGNMEKGSLRCDINVSLHEEGTPFGTRCEVKNVTGIQFVGKAIEFEIARQTKLLNNNQKVDQETRLYDTKTNKTVLLRKKENAPDYKFIPDPGNISF